MRFYPSKVLVAVMALCASVGCVAGLAQTPEQIQKQIDALPKTVPWNDVGTPMTPEEIGAMAKDTGPSGKGLPQGRGTAKEGMPLYMAKCSMCHGTDLKGVTQPPGSGNFYTASALVGGKGLPLWGADGPNTVSRALFVAYPTTMWNTIAVSMPFFKPGSLTPNEVYSLVAFILAKNEIIKEDDVMDIESLPKLKMPQRDSYMPANFDDILNVQKRACFQTFAICEPVNGPAAGSAGQGTAPTARPNKP